jgi:phosphonate dehydrogenase
VTPKPHKVVVTHWVPEDVLDYLREFSQPVAPCERTVFSQSEVGAHALDATAILACMADRVDELFLAACPRLRVISAALKGFDNFDAAACERRGVWLTIVPDLLTEPTADLAIALTLDVTRRVTEADRQLRANGFAGWRPVFYGHGLSGATVGLLGMGAVGRAVARRLIGFGCHIVYCDPRPLSPHEERRYFRAAAQFRRVAHGVRHRAISASAHREHPSPAGHHGDRPAPPGRVPHQRRRGSVVDEQAVAAALTAASSLATRRTYLKWKTGHLTIDHKRSHRRC